MKVRRGGVLSRAGQALTATEQAALDGDPRALRALVRQAAGVNTLDAPLQAELRAGGAGELVFTGYASVTDTPYQMSDWLGPYTEIMRSGCFTRTLAGNPDVIFCLNHDWDAAPMARTNSRMGAPTMTLAEDSTGLHVEARLDPTRADVRILQSCMDRGELDAMSFAFWTTAQTWSPDYEQRDIHEADLDGGDASQVTWPANPATTGTTSLRKRQAAALARSRVPSLLLERARAAKRAAAALDDPTRLALQAVLDLIAAADVAVDGAQPILAELLGVPNPDVDEPADAEPDADPDDYDADVPVSQFMSTLDAPTEPAETRMSVSRLRLAINA